MPPPEEIPVPPLDPDLAPVLDQVRRRGRQLRRLRAARLVAAVVAVALIGAASWVGLGAGPRTQLAAGSGGARPGTARPGTARQSSALPPTLVAATPAGTGSPGTIELISSATGQVLRALARTYTGYTENGLARSPDGSTVYFDRLLQVGQGQVEISAVPSAGGPIVNVAAGIDPAVSPGGKSLAYLPEADLPSSRAAGPAETVAVRDLATGAVRTIDLSGLIGSGYRVPPSTGLAWSSGGTHLAVLADKYTPLPSCPRPIPTGCPTPTTAPGPSSRLVILDLTRAHPAARAVVLSLPEGRAQWTFVAGARQPGHIVVYEVGHPSSTPAVGRLVEINVNRPDHPQQVLASTSGGIEPLALDRSAAHLLYGTGDTVTMASLSHGSLSDFHALPGRYVAATW